MDNDWKHSPVRIPTALFKTDVLGTADKLPVTVRLTPHPENHSGPNCACFSGPARPGSARPEGSVTSDQTDTCYEATCSRPLNQCLPHQEATSKAPSQQSHPRLPLHHEWDFSAVFL